MYEWTLPMFKSRMSTVSILALLLRIEISDIQWCLKVRFDYILMQQGKVIVLLLIAETIRIGIPDIWSGISSSSDGTENMETLFIWEQCVN